MYQENEGNAFSLFNNRKKEEDNSSVEHSQISQGPEHQEVVTPSKRKPQLTTKRSAINVNTPGTPGAGADFSKSIK